MRQAAGSQLVGNVETLDALAGLLGVPRNSLQLTTLFNFNSCDPGWRNVEAFHSSCDRRGPTIVLIRSSDGNTNGAYTSVSWDKNASYQQDQQAFLFRIWPEPGHGSRQNLRTEKFQISASHHAQISSACQGPTFGGGHDLATFGSNGLSLTMTPSSYPTYGPLINSSVPKDTSNFQLEVLQATATSSGSSGEMEMPWLPGVTWSLEDGTRLQKDLFEFSPTARRFPVHHLNLLLCGGVGAGKSSIVSTLDSLCEGRISRLAPHGQGTGSLTRKLHKYSFADPDSKNKVHWQLWDTMGWGVTDYKKGELGYILDGNLPNRCKLDDNISLKTPGFKAAPIMADAVHCMCMVVPCDAASDDSYMARFREMQQFARDREIPTLVFLTKIDLYDPDVIGQDLEKTFHSERLLSLVEELANSSGIGGHKDILPIKNSSEAAPTAEARVLICRALQQALYAAVDYLRINDMELTEDDELA